MMLAVVGVALNLLGVFIINLHMQESGMDMPTFFAVICVLWGLSAVGLLLHVSGMKKAGGILVIIGSIIFVPMGLVAIFGAKKMMTDSKDDLDARRQLAKE